MKTITLRTRLTAWYTLGLVAVLGVFGVDVIWGQRRLGLRRVDRELDGLSATMTHIIGNELQEREPLAIAAEQARRVVATSGTAVAVLDERGAPLTASWGDLDGDSALKAARSGAAAWTIETRRGPWRAHAVSPVLGQTRVSLLVARSLADVEREQNEVLEAMEIALPVMLLLAGGGGFWLASVGLRPLREMADRATALAPAGMEDLGHAERSDELGTLARSFNGLVARLRAALRTQQQFMADASHELRTPVSVVRAAADVALSRPARNEAEYRETLAIVGDQARRLTRLVDNMLVLARADAGGYRLKAIDLYLDEVVAECCRALNPLSAERQVTIRTESWPEVPFRGDEELLRQLLMNVLQNAVQHTPPGGRVSVDINPNGETVRIRVTDSGPGIAEADRSRIFDRFVQLDAARRGAGTGLGLPIARWIAEAHGGTVALEASGPGGSTFCISLSARRV
jgi:heavy metal sensor kinase